MLDVFYRFIENLGYTHPLHPTQVNMPIGLVVVSFILLLLSLLRRSSGLAISARYCMLAAFLFLIPTVIAGFMDWQHYYSGGWIYPIKIKMGLAGFLFILLFAAFFMDRQDRKTKPSLPLLINYGLCLVTVVALGYLGAGLVFTGRTPIAGQEYTAGRMLFKANCSGCHPYGGNIVKPKHNLWYNPRLEKVDYLQKWLRNPDSPMPVFFPVRLPDSQVKELFIYLNKVFYQKSHHMHTEEDEREHH